MVENERVKILWDFNIQTDREIKHGRPDIVVVNKEKYECTIIDVANPSDQNLAQKKFEKLDNYSELRLEVARMWNYGNGTNYNRCIGLSTKGSTVLPQTTRHPT